MKIIKVFSSFCDSENCKNVYERLYDLNNNPNYGKTFIFTTDENYTHALLLNTAMPKLNIPKKNVIGMAVEPIEYLGLTHTFINYVKENIGKYLIGSDAEKFGEPFINHYSYMWHITPLSYQPKKNKLMSIMISNKMHAPGHKYRHILAQKILQSNLPIDIYGKGCKYYSNINDKRLKGEFESLEPYEKYQFHIAIENFQKDSYFSEKITNTLLCNSTPIYLGCKNIDNYFKECVIILSGNIDKDINMIRSICTNPSIYLKNVNNNDIVHKLSIENVINLF
jgi:hypothetical protein